MHRICLSLISVEICYSELASCLLSEMQRDWSICMEVLTIQTSSLDTMSAAGTHHYFSLAHKLQPQNILSYGNDKPNKREIHSECPCGLVVAGTHHLIATFQSWSLSYWISLLLFPHTFQFIEIHFKNVSILSFHANCRLKKKASFGNVW